MGLALGRDDAPDYPALLHCPPFLRFSIACMQFCAHIQPGVAHFFEHALMHALTSQLLAASTDGAKATVSAKKNIADRKASDRRRDMDDSCK
jgi:hypothetical protein